MAARFFMVVAEAGFGPGLPCLLSFFYMRQELGFRCGISSLHRHSQTAFLSVDKIFSKYNSQLK
jgi:hypothetical protein